MHYAGFDCKRTVPLQSLKVVCIGSALYHILQCMVERRPGKRQQYHWKYYPLIEDYRELLKIYL